MSRTRMLVLSGLLIGLVLLLAVAVWAFFIFQSRNSSSVALSDVTATAEAARLTLSPLPGTPALSATIAPTDTSVPGTVQAGTATPTAPAGTVTTVAPATSAPSAATTTGTPAATDTPTPTATAAALPTGTPTSTATGIPASTATNTPTIIPSDTPTNTPTNTPTSTPTDTPVPLAVTNLSASVNPPSSNSCPVTFNFTGQITTNGPGTVTYVWQRSDGSSMSNQSEVFASAGTHAVHDSWPVATAGNYGAHVHIISPNAQDSNQATATETCGNFAGGYYLNFGSMSLTQNTNGVTGSYDNALQGQSGTIAGTVTANTFNGSYTIGGGSGSLQLTLSNNGLTLDGTWSTIPPFGGGKWCGARPGINFPAGCGFAGAWNAREDSTATDKVALTQNGTGVSGTFFNGTENGTITNGSVTYSGQQAVLSATWHVTGASGPLKFFLVGYNDVQFQGHYDTSNAWCGWRGGAAQPSPCEK